ncbi:MAG: hypothetical protein A2Y07_00370 [Planctomycetes bacterium GWF2_50_10]|nr:MAG: hypothetical protein A2Y07_00370 [Planctomycetes bacterium GWF2_50_10]
MNIRLPYYKPQTGSKTASIARNGILAKKKEAPTQVLPYIGGGELLYLFYVQSSGFVPEKTFFYQTTGPKL